MATQESTQVAAAKPWRESYVVYRNRAWAGVVSRNVGTREELLALGFLSDASRLPNKPRGCTSRYVSDNMHSDEKISMLTDGRLRVRLGGLVAATRDPEFRAFLATVLTAPASGIEP